MKSNILRFSFLLVFISTLQVAQAQSASGGNNNLMIIGLMVVAAILILFAIIQVADSLMRVEAHNLGVDKEGVNYSVFPNSEEIVGEKVPAFASNKKVKVLKKGYDIKLQGAAEPKVNQQIKASTFAIQPGNFRGIGPIPKVVVEVGNEVKAGDPICYDKRNEDMKLVAPVSGEIVAINRGAKRAIAEIVILADKENRFRKIDAPNLDGIKRADLVSFLMKSGVWPSIIQRPFDTVASPTELPKNIFISTFDSAPMAPDVSFQVKGEGKAFQKGLDVLKHLTPGQVHLGLDARADLPSPIFTGAKGVSKNWFKGPHPSGNVGVQIHHTDPINSGDIVWTVKVQDVVTLGKLFTEGKYDTSRLIALTGADLEAPAYVRTYPGAKIGDLLSGQVSGENNRILSGDVLSGKEKTAENFLNTSDDQITVLEEGNEYEAFGWLLPFKSRPSISRTFPNFLFPDLTFKANTNTHGEKRAFVVTGQYEKMLPMDVYPQHLFKAILANDIERMEGLGLYELTEEDVALAEFACTSKQPLQSIIRDGLDTLLESA